MINFTIPPFNNLPRVYTITFIALILVVGLARIAYPVLDEYQWIAAGKLFQQAIFSLDWDKTYVGSISGHPGVTILWLSATFHTVREFLQLSDTIILHRYSFFVLQLIILLTASRLLQNKLQPLSLFLLIAYLIINPHLFGVGASWLDQILSWLMVFCLISWIEYIKTSNDLWLIITGLLFGASILTKIAGFFLIPMLFGILLMESAPLSRVIANSNQDDYKVSLKDLLAVGLIGFLLYFIAYPAMWSDPIGVLTARFQRSADVQLNTEILAENSPLEFYLPTLIFAEPMIAIAIILLGIRLYSSRFRFTQLFQTFSGQLITAGIIYLVALITVGFIFSDRSNGPNAFLAVRYLTPIIPLFSIFVFRHAEMYLSTRWKLICFTAIAIHPILQLPYLKLILEKL